MASDSDRLDSSCVIKQFFPTPAIHGNSYALAKAIQLFEGEARQLLQLGNHPQIPSLFAYFEQDQRLYLVQEFIDGQDLGEELDKNQQNIHVWGDREILQLLRDLLPVLQFVHNAGVIHRDIKPTNILRRRSHRSVEEKLVLIDFGVSKQISNTNLSQIVPTLAQKAMRRSNSCAAVKLIQLATSTV